MPSISTTRSKVPAPACRALQWAQAAGARGYVSKDTAEVECLNVVGVLDVGDDVPGSAIAPRRVGGAAAVEAVALHTQVLVFSGLVSGEALQRAQAAGARGYVSKDTAEVECLIDGIDAVLGGSDFVDPALLAQIGALLQQA